MRNHGDLDRMLISQERNCTGRGMQPSQLTQEQKEKAKAEKRAKRLSSTKRSENSRKAADEEHLKAIAAAGNHTSRCPRHDPCGHERAVKRLKELLPGCQCSQTDALRMDSGRDPKLSTKARKEVAENEEAENEQKMIETTYIAMCGPMSADHGGRIVALNTMPEFKLRDNEKRDFKDPTSALFVCEHRANQKDKRLHGTYVVGRDQVFFFKKKYPFDRRHRDFVKHQISDFNKMLEAEKAVVRQLEFRARRPRGPAAKNGTKTPKRATKR
jgi:hypothetical protein